MFYAKKGEMPFSCALFLSELPKYRAIIRRVANRSYHSTSSISLLLFWLQLQHRIQRVFTLVCYIVFKLTSSLLYDMYTHALSIFISYSYSFQWSPFKCLWEKRSVHFPYHIPSIQQALTTYFLSFQLATSKWPKHNWGSHVGISSNSNTIVPVLFL